MTRPARLCSSAGEGNSADTLLFDNAHSGQLAVRRLSPDPQPLLQLDLPMLAPVDAVPPDAGKDSELVKR